MISEEDIKQLVLNQMALLQKHYNEKALLQTQIYWGQLPHLKNQHPGGCGRHLWTFDKFNIIPRHCFNCYKVLIEPQTVMDLFKLMQVLDKLVLPNDNARKCMTENRDKISGTYKGYIYCDGIDEARKILKIVRAVLSEKMSTCFPVSLKHGCSEYSNAYPEYGLTGQDNAMVYREEWHEQEELADQEFIIDKDQSIEKTFNHPSYTINDAGAMLSWLRYAATIGDLSYLNISGSPVPPFDNLNRAPFHPTGD